jgi:outer membrane protein assembly factor BamB/plastocyanin
MIPTTAVTVTMTPTVTITPTEPVVVGGIPADVQAAMDQWPMANQDYGNMRQAQNSTINSENVDQLGIGWTFEIPGIGAYGAAASNPLIAGDRVYLQDLASNIHALDFETGEVIWQAMYDEASVGPNGPALGNGMIYAQGGINRIRALDAETGEEVWMTELDGPTGAQQPYVYDGLVFTGTGAGAINEDANVAYRGYVGGTTGYAYALDAATGEQVWRFQVVEEDFWGNPDVNSGGGIWFPPAIDTETNVVFWGTGNPAPFPGTEEWPNASSRPGPNLYTNSIIAFEHDTGEMLWYKQVKPHDLFDLDFQAPRILTTAEIVGEEQKIVIGAGKAGRVLAFNPENGDILWETSVGRHLNDRLDSIPVDEATLVFPSTLGGVETPMSLADGVVYVPVVDIPSIHRGDGFNAANGTEALNNVTTKIEEGTGSIVAIDVSNGNILWTTDLESPVFAGTTVINDLVFTADYNGMIYALDREDGSQIWSYQAPAGINAWPAVAGDTIVWPAGAGENPTLVALRLGAAMPTPAPTDEAAAEGPYQQSPWWPYLSAHMENETPPDIIGGPVVLTITQESGGVNWALPAQRELDPTIFGTASNPMATEVPPIILGVPMNMRTVLTDGTFTTNVMTPFGDAYASSTGTLNLSLTDATATDGATSKDQIDLVATFDMPGENGGTYRVEVNQVAPHGWFYPTAGGVATNYIQHGLTRWGSQLMPTQFVFAGFWGVGNVYLDDEEVATNRLVHGMLGEFVRGENYELVWDEEVNPNQMHFHLLLPPFTPQGASSPVSTGFMLPNGMEQPFFHVMFPALTIESAGATEAIEITQAPAPTATPTTAATGTPQASPAATEAPGEEAEATTIEVIARNFEFEPTEIEVQAGQPVTFVVTSPDIYHTFTVKQSEGAAENLINLDVYPDEGPAEVTYTFEEAGEYYLYCIPHESLGMTGTIIVTE